MKLLNIIVFMFFIGINLYGTNSYDDFHIKSVNTNNYGMYALGTWAIVNMSTGIYGWSKYSGDRKYFSQMNFFWNTVNISIATISLYNNFSPDASILTDAEIIKKHTKLENIYLINAGLDVIYMGSGAFLRHLSVKNEKNTDLLKGYGNSLILQGGFLFVFDLIMFQIQRSARIDFLDKINILPGQISMTF